MTLLRFERRRSGASRSVPRTERDLPPFGIGSTSKRGGLEALLLLPGNTAMPTFDLPGGMLRLPAGDLDLSGRHAGHERHVAGIVGLTAFPAFSCRETGQNNKLNHGLLRAAQGGC